MSCPPSHMQVRHELADLAADGWPINYFFAPPLSLLITTLSNTFLSFLGSYSAPLPLIIVSPYWSLSSPHHYQLIPIYGTNPRF
jgi:hypothetical protein